MILQIFFSIDYIFSSIDLIEDKKFSIFDHKSLQFCSDKKIEEKIEQIDSTKVVDSYWETVSNFAWDNRILIGVTIAVAITLTLIYFNVDGNSGTPPSPPTVSNTSNTTISQSDSGNLENLSNVPTTTVIDSTEVTSISNTIADVSSSNVLSQCTESVVTSVVNQSEKILSSVTLTIQSETLTQELLNQSAEIISRPEFFEQVGFLQVLLPYFQGQYLEEMIGILTVRKLLYLEVEYLKAIDSLGLQLWTEYYPQELAEQFDTITKKIHRRMLRTLINCVGEPINPVKDYDASDSDLDSPLAGIKEEIRTRMQELESDED